MISALLHLSRAGTLLGLFPFQPVFKPMSIGQFGQPSLVCVAFRPNSGHALKDGLARLVIVCHGVIVPLWLG
jgi:hypothetical protein